MEPSSEPTKFTVKTINSLAKDLTVFVGLVVRGVLDTNKLESAATELVSRWPILGGKLLTNTTPYSFETGQQVDFETRKINRPLQEFFPVDFNINNQGPDDVIYRTQEQGNASEEYFHFNTLKHLNMLPQNIFTVRVTVLHDATLLGFRIPHHVGDGESVYHAIKAYRDIIASERIPTIVMPPDVDEPLSTILKEDTGVKLPAKMEIADAPYLNPYEIFKLGLLPWIRYVGYALLKMTSAKLGFTSKTEEKYIHLSGKMVENLKSSCQKELNDSLIGSGTEAPVLSNLDIVTGWFLQTSFRNLPRDNGPVDLMHNFSYRFALPPPKPNTLYLKNSYYPIRVHWDSLQALQTAPLFHLVLAIRTAILQSKQAPAIKANLEFQEKYIKELVAPGWKGMRLDFLPFVSSWTTFPYNGMDFSGALVDDESSGDRDGEGGSEKLGKVVFTQPRVALPMGIMVDPLAIVLKDGEGGYWIRANLSKRAWAGHGS